MIQRARESERLEHIKLVERLAERIQELELDLAGCRAHHEVMQNMVALALTQLAGAKSPAAHAAKKILKGVINAG